MADVISTTASKFTSAINTANLLKTAGWIVFFLLLIGGLIFVYIIWKNKKVFNKKITVFEIVGNYWNPIRRDTAKVVKFGKGGFEILQLKKSKVYKIGYGGRVGKDTYYFFIGKDGYWYNGMLSANLHAIDENGGLIPIVTTNPTMRAQYTALEKQIDDLYKKNAGFLEKYGGWIMAIGFVLVIGVMAWLIFKEMNTYAGQMSSLLEKVGNLVGNVDNMITTSETIKNGGSGLVPVSS